MVLANRFGWWWRNKNMLTKFIGIIIIIDGIVSILWAFEPRLLWQTGRLIRIILGIVLIFV